MPVDAGAISDASAARHTPRAASNAQVASAEHATGASRRRRNSLRTVVHEPVTQRQSPGVDGRAQFTPGVGRCAATHAIGVQGSSQPQSASMRQGDALAVIAAGVVLASATAATCGRGCANAGEEHAASSAPTMASAMADDERCVVFGIDGSRAYPCIEAASSRALRAKYGSHRGLSMSGRAAFPGRRRASSGRRRASSGRRRASGGRRRASSGRRRASSGRRRVSSGRRRASSGRRRVSSWRRRVSSGRRRASSGRRRAPSGRQSYRRAAAV